MSLSPCSEERVQRQCNIIIIHQNVFSWMIRPGGVAINEKILFTGGAKRIFRGARLFSVFFHYQAALIGKEF